MKKIENVIFYSIEKAIKTYRQFAQQELKKKKLAITVDQWLLLSALEGHPGASQKELAATVFKDTASVTRMIELMVKNGLLNRKEHNPDRRRSNLQITAKGKQLLKATAGVVASYRKKAIKDIRPDHLETARRVMVSIISNCQ